MKILFPLVAVAMLVSCSNKKKPVNNDDPLDPNNHKDDKTEQTDDSSWSSKDKKQAQSDCVDYLTQRNVKSSEAKELCSCTVDKIQGDMSFDDFEAVYQKDDRPTEKKLQKPYDRLDEAAKACLKKIKPDQKDTDEDDKPKKKTKNDDE